MAITVGPYNFPAEHLLVEHPPDYERERMFLLLKLVSAMIFFLVVFPTFLAKPVEEEKEGAVEKFEPLPTIPETKRGKKTRNINKPTKKSPKKESTKAIASSSSSASTRTPTNNSNGDNGAAAKNEKEEEEVIVAYEVNPMGSVVGVIGCMISCAWILLTQSPDNYYTPNRVFSAPLLTRDECQTVLNMADQAANVNYETSWLKLEEEEQKQKEQEQQAKIKVSLYGNGDIMNNDDDNDGNNNATIQQLRDLLQEPRGWHKKRHESYPTTDLNLVVDPFTLEDRTFLQEKFHARLTPLLQRIWGIPPSSIRCNDMFVVRYDAGKQSHLDWHEDEGTISFNVLLDDDFEGGGTLFWHKVDKEPFAHVQPDQVGQVLLHSSSIRHMGVHVEKGRRTILVGFLEVDRINPFVETHEESTGLSWYASWGSIPWVTHKMNQGYIAVYRRLERGREDWKNNEFVRGFMLFLRTYLEQFRTHFIPHEVSHLVDNDNRQAFLSALDTAYNHKKEAYGQQRLQLQKLQANWFRGQNVAIDVSGGIEHVWGSRKENSYRFEEL